MPFLRTEECPGKADDKGVVPDLSSKQNRVVFDVSGGTDGGRDGTDLVPTGVLTQGLLPGSALAPWEGKVFK